MPQDVTDDLERHSGSQQTHGTRMAKGVGPVFALRDDSSGAEAGSRHTVEDRAGFERTMRREDTEEDFSIYPDSAEIRKTPLPIALEAILLHP